jgi:IS4 transposase
MISDLYRRRREIETLFKRLKQNLVIKEFLWTSMNAVQSQIRIALIYFLVLHYIKLQTKTKESLTVLARKLKSLLFKRTDILVLIWTSVEVVHKALGPPWQGLFENMVV